MSGHNFGVNNVFLGVITVSGVEGSLRGGIDKSVRGEWIVGVRREELVKSVRGCM